MFSCNPECMSGLASLRFRKYGLSVDVDIHWVKLPLTKTDDTLFPVILVSDLIEALGRSGNMERLWGDIPEGEVQDTLLEFWKRYAQDSPDHQVYRASREGYVCLARSIPYLIHGDEGRGLKKKGVMLLSIQGVLGRGTRPFAQRFKDARSERVKRMGVNIGGHSFGSRLLFAAMMKKHYDYPDLCLFINLSFFFSIIICKPKLLLELIRKITPPCSRTLLRTSRCCRQASDTEVKPGISSISAAKAIYRGSRKQVALRGIGCEQNAKREQRLERKLLLACAICVWVELMEFPGKM